MNVQDPVLQLIREHLSELFFGTVFSFVGTTACLISALHRRIESRLLTWFGLFIGLYGARLLAHLVGILGLFPQSKWPGNLEIAVNYLLVVPAFLFWAGRTRSYLKRTFQVLAGIGLGVAILGLGWYAISGSPYTFMRWSLLLAIGSMLLLGPLAVIPKIFNKYFAVQSVVLRVVLPAVSVFVLVVDIRLFLGHPPARYVEPIGFAVWVFAIGYEAAKHTFDNERRLVAIEIELETARQIQESLLPSSLPNVAGLRIAASYHPMSAVAGDYYQFLQLDEHRIGILVADVSGHGVPAALIASMIKVATQSVMECADEPGEVLSNLNRILTPELRGQLTSAAYLWMDTEARAARYSSAGHPPLFHWKCASKELARIESNGLLFGVADKAEYPVCDLALCQGDRFLLYSDGLVEPENTRGESFGERQIESVIHNSDSLPSSELAERLLSALRSWQPPNATQSDDITLVAVDILQAG
jgi:sigma-B regulation protein RsbU (phosphoserine phosphatase)